MNRSGKLILSLSLVGCLLGIGSCDHAKQHELRQHVVFWHFWGGDDRDIVDDVVQKFNDSQSKYWVRAIAMPGNNLDTKLFLSIAGGDPPDLVNQDDPIVADWAYRGIITPFDEFVPAQELAATNQSLVPAARNLGRFDDKTFAVANGLDIRAFLYNKSFLDQRGLVAPETIKEFDAICQEISPPGSARREYFAYLPDARRLWTWAYVFGGDFLENGQLKITFEENRNALEWMQQFSRWYGPDEIAAFRRGDQSLPGKTFPLLPVADDQMVGRYVFALAGQWNARDVQQFIENRQSKGLPCPRFAVCPLPAPTAGRIHSGWVNGNVFVVPRGADAKQGAWEFVQFWIGEKDVEIAATTCAKGGWIPVTRQVARSDVFVEFMNANPIFGKYVELSQSKNLLPYPMVPGAPFLVRRINTMTEIALEHPNRSVDPMMDEAEKVIRDHIRQIERNYSKGDQP